MMIRILAGLLLLSGMACTLSGQTRVTLADVYAEVEQLRAQVGRLRLEMEAMQRENETLRTGLETQSRQQQALVSNYNTFVSKTNTLLSGLPERERALKQEVFSEMTKQMEDLAAQVQDGFDALTRARGTSAQSQAVSFDNDYPQTGVTYVVKPGDSLSKIAREHGSTVRDIQNANKIRDPSRDLMAGATIFVPQRNP
ncbi:MAG: LysM domain-containing protein [Verrucomicrobiota bacterium]